MRKFLLICALLGPTVSGSAAEKPILHPQTFLPPPTAATTLTVYSGGYAFVEVRQPIDFAGADTIFLEVASTVVPDSIVFMSLDPAVTLREQRYTPGRKFDAASIFREHIGDTVRIMGGRRGRIEGTLVNVDGHIVVATENGIEIVRDYGHPRWHILLVGKVLPNFRDEARNGVHLDLFTDKPGRYDTRLFYEAGGIGWRAHYNAILSDAPALINAGSRAIEPGRHLLVNLHGQATITNGSNSDFGDATVRLVAGDVRRRHGRRPKMMEMGRMSAVADAGGGGFEQKAFFEHHLYTLGRSMSLPKRSSVQTELFPVVRGMAGEKILMFNASPPSVSPYPVTRPDIGGIGTVDVSLRFKNTSKHPWPAGTIRFSKVDGDKLVFVGEGAIGHTPVGRSVSMSVGTAFDVKAERKRIGFNVKRIGNEVVEITEAFETTIHNHKDTAVTVYVRETMWRWLTKFKFAIDKRDGEHKFTSDVPGRAVEIELHIPANSKVTVKYDIRYHR